MTRPLCSVVTATWGRPRTILEHAIPSVAAQDYPATEHIVVTDGRDESLQALLRGAGYEESAGSPRRLACLGRNWSQVHGDGGVGAIPRLVGSYLAAGDYLAWLDDDNDWEPGHVSAMVSALERTGAGLACCAWRDGPGGSVGGSAPPRAGHVDTGSIMVRAEILRHGAWRPEGYGCDHMMVERWLAAGVKWTFLPEPTMILNGHRRGAPD